VGSDGALDSCTIGRREKDLEANINARLVAGARQCLHWHLCTGAGYVPTVRLPGDCDRLDLAHDWTAPADGDTAHLGQDLAPVVQLGAVATRPVGEGVGAPFSKTYRFLPKHRTGLVPASARAVSRRIATRRQRSPLHRRLGGPTTSRPAFRDAWLRSGHGL